MVLLARLVATVAVSLGTLLAFPAGTWSAGPLPDPPATVPALPAAPTIGVTPGNGGATVDVGVGDTNLRVGVGPGGVSVGPRPKASSPGAGGSEPGLPVSTPGDPPGRNASPIGVGPGGVVFGPRSSGATSARSSGATSAAGGRRSRARPPSTSRPEKGRDSSATQDALSGRKSTGLPPSLEFINHIPPIVWAGIVALALIALAIWAAWVRQRRRFEQNAFVDPVTGIANAPAFDGLLERELERARRYKRPLALLLLELSDVHQSVLPLRDQTLRDATGAIRDTLREGDVIARLGPSRFAVISPEATATSGETLARAIERRLEELRLHVAVGTVERQPTDLTAGHLLVRAQSAMTPPDPQPEPARGRNFLRAA